VKKTPRFTPAVVPQKTSLQKIIQSQTRTSLPPAKAALRNSGSGLLPNKTSTPRNTTVLPSLLRKATPVNTAQQNNTSIKPNILKQSLNPGRLTSTPIIDVGDSAENRQKKIEKEERMREAGKNESKKRGRTPSTDQPTKNGKRIAPFMTPPLYPTGIPDQTHSINFGTMFSKEKTDNLEPLQDKANPPTMLFFVSFQK